MMIAGKIVCFNCQGKRRDKNLRPFPLKKLEVIRKGKNPKKKGKVIAEAWVCMSCYNEGHDKVPFGGFNGEMKTAALPQGILEKAKEGMARAEQIKKQEASMYPTKK